jgi:hypothetical protein
MNDWFTIGKLGECMADFECLSCEYESMVQFSIDVAEKAHIQTISINDSFAFANWAQ